MNREQAYLRMLSSTANMQWNIAIMLEAKAAEAEKLRSWICNHLYSHSFSSQQSQLGQSIQMHEQVIEVIEGITKLNQGMVSILKAVLPDDEEDNGNSGTSFGKSISFGDND
ncbi:restriction endonuclease subunit S [Paenibacillus prosopidis]|uniref:Restriction endonuclease subunit S n=1 Tax=Paenibacillus prosopidis TaxID=630520 RepID=A0A368VSF2_9BACL|nr:restriction endonuclease subunit S [Paenibacillus prosopidis]RCW43397.1 hypothetical protein DFP97_11369 [Paenibacillus prosopidis]